MLLTFQWKLADLRDVVPTFRWTTDSQIASLTPDWIDSLDRIARDAEAKGQADVAGLSKNLRDALASRERKAIEAAAGKMAALGSRTLAGALGVEIRGHAAARPERVFAWSNLSKVLTVAVGFLAIGALGIALIGARVVPFLIGLPASSRSPGSRVSSRAMVCS